jgi:arylsulfatase A-like enzyme
MIETLENIGELENTVIIVTADNGMPFPRVKGQAYEYSNHLPLAMSWPAGIKKPGRRVNDVVSFIDFAPTFLELANIDQEVSGMQAITGKSLTDILFSNKSELVTDYRDHVLIGKERHDIGRPDDQCYPIRGIMKDGMLYIRNFKPDRWPGGDPVTGYLNCDGSPTKTQILNLNRSNSDIKPWELSFGKRVDEELYDISKDPECIVNLALNGEYQDLKKELASQLETELKDQKDPRIHGNGDVFDKYTYANKKHRNYYNRFISGEIIDAGWVNKTDYESK